MLHANQSEIRKKLLLGEFGLEKESLRVNSEGFLSHTAHPFGENKHIVRDFCENQTEINTSVGNSAQEAVAQLEQYNREIQRRLASLENREYLWPFSNPPYIRSEADVPIAHYEGVEVSKTLYRQYLSDRYGRYKMTFSGIHVNYSFQDDLLRSDFSESDETDFLEYKNKLYIELAKKAAIYGWILVAISAASPLMDSSFVEKGQFDKDEFCGMASVRCSEMGYWNSFAPIFDYSSLESYIASIQSYVDDGLLKAPTELYYPIRLKPAGKNSLESLAKKGVNHIELRMFDLNPLVPAGIEVKDLEFAQLLLVWLASTPAEVITRRDQVQAVQNFKNAAHYDLKTVKIMEPGGENHSAARAALNLIGRMKEFYQDFPQSVLEVLSFEENKFIDAENRYAWQIRKQYSGGFVRKGMELARKRQAEYLGQ